MAAAVDTPDPTGPTSAITNSWERRSEICVATLRSFAASVVRCGAACMSFFSVIWISAIG